MAETRTLWRGRTRAVRAVGAVTQEQPDVEVGTAGACALCLVSFSDRSLAARGELEGATASAATAATAANAAN